MGRRGTAPPVAATKREARPQSSREYPWWARAADAAADVVISGKSFPDQFACRVLVADMELAKKTDCCYYWLI